MALPLVPVLFVAGAAALSVGDEGQVGGTGAVPHPDAGNPPVDEREPPAPPYILGVSNQAPTAGGSPPPADPLVTVTEGAITTVEGAAVETAKVAVAGAGAVLLAGGGIEGAAAAAGSTFANAASAIAHTASSAAASAQGAVGVLGPATVVAGDALIAAGIVYSLYTDPPSLDSPFGSGGQEALTVVTDPAQIAAAQAALYAHQQALRVHPELMASAQAIKRNLAQTGTKFGTTREEIL